MRSPRRALRAGVVGLVALALAAATAYQLEGAPSSQPPEPESDSEVPEAFGRVFASRPDLPAPLIHLERYASTPGASADDDPILLAPKDGEPMTGPLIVDASGEPVWIRPLQDLAGQDLRAYDLRVQKYKGEPVLTWWAGLNLGVGYGFGVYQIMDRSYDVIAQVNTQGSQSDHHGMTLTDDGTALLITYRKLRRDLTAVDGPADGWMVNCVVQEVDVETGKVVFSWSGLDHVPITDTLISVGPDRMVKGTEAAPLDYLHVNSVTEDADGSLLISARNTHAVYRVDRETGEVDWILGGKSSDFRMLGDSRFAWQHDAQRQADGTLTLFDNEAGPPVGEESRGLRLRLDPQKMTARVVTEYLPPDGRLAHSQGNLQVRDNGHVVIGWGGLPYYSEYTRDGKLLYDARIINGVSYRAYRLPWVGEPREPPSLVVDDGTAHVSWNGATEVASWRFLAGPSPSRVREVVTAPRTGFETAVDVPDAPYIRVQALNSAGKILATQDFGGRNSTRSE